MMLLGDRTAVDAFLATPEGARFARQIAAAIFEDEDRLADFELGENLGLPVAVEYALDRLITARNRSDA